jgi:beta-galactosidase/beta-glucuronidase
MVRQDWLNLNGLWEYAILAKDAERPGSFDGQILVPFPVESALSGVMKPVGPGNRLWYRRTFEISAKWSGKNVLLHFGAVDWEATVWVNGKELGTHRGGYDPFTFDITDALKDSGRQEIVLSVWDPTDAGSQPRGKQVRKPNGIWYTAVTGIWQTVWLEPVPQIHIESLKITADVDGQAVEVLANVSAAVGDFDLKVAVFDGSKQVCQGQVIKISGGTSSVARPSVKLPVKDARLWTI